MKTELHFQRFFASLLLAMMLLVSTVIKAVDVIAPNTDYYILNVETDLFLGGQNLYGTQGAVSDDAGIFQFVPGTTSPGYNIMNTLVTTTDKNLGTDLYTDNNGQMTVKDNEWDGTTKIIDGIWEIQYQGNGIFAFYCGSSWAYTGNEWVETKHGYLAKSATTGLKKGYILEFSEEITDACLFRVLTRQEALAYMMEKSQSENVSFNFLIKVPDFCHNQSTNDNGPWGFTPLGSSTKHNYCGGSNNNKCAESWRTHFVCNQTIYGLPAGRYKLSAQGFYRLESGTLTDETTPYLYAGSSYDNTIAKVNIPLRTGTENSMSDASNSFSDGKYQIEPIQFYLTETTDLEIGFCSPTDQCWVIWDNVQLTPYFPSATNITISPTELTKAIGETYQLNATVLPAEARQYVTWQSSNPEVASVDENGLVTAIADGTATITATTIDGTNLSATCDVTVSTAPTTSVTLNQAEFNLWGWGTTQQLQATVYPDNASKVVAWASSDESVASVDENGLVTAVGGGSAIITVTTTDGTDLSATCEITVTIPLATSITQNQTELEKIVGETYQLTVTVLPEGSLQNVTWQSSNSEVATVDETGLITAVGKGTATITATTTDGTELSANSSVTVTLPVVVSGMCGENAIYTLYGDMTLVISGTGDMTSTPWMDSYSQDIKTVIIEDGVTSIDNCAFYFCSGLTSVTIGNSVTSIGNEAFRGCSGLISITIPENVTSIGSYAFQGCSDLTSAALNSNAIVSKSYYYNNTICHIFGSQVTEYIIGDAVTSIGSCAFSGCSGLTSITIPSSVTSIGGLAFFECSGLSSIEIPNSVTSIGNNAFQDCSSLSSITIPESVTSIGYNTFYGCTSLPVIDNIRYADIYLVEAVDKTKSTYSIKDGTRFIGNNAFSGCTELTSVAIPNSVISLGSNAFNSVNLFDIKFASDIPATKGDNTFMGDAFLFVPYEALETYKTAWSDIANRIYSDDLSTETTESTAVDGKSALLDAIGGVGKESSIVLLKVRGSLNGYDIMLIRNKMTNLRYLDLSEARIVKEANNYEYYTGCYTKDDVLGANSFSNLGLIKVVLPKDITSINGYAFYGCSNLLEVTGMPTTCLNIGGSAFENCTRIRIVDIGTGVTSIGSDAFRNCYGLTSITMGNSVTRIWDYAFENCLGLTSFTMGNNVTSIGRSAFFNCSSLKDIVFSRNLERIEGSDFTGCFEGCSSLEELRLPASLKYIGQRAFYGCSSLREVHIPSMVESIANDAFTGGGLTDVYAYTISPISIGQNTFKYAGVTLHAPQTPESVFNAYYYNTQWSQFTNVVDFQAEYTSWYAPEDYDVVVEAGEEIPSEDKENGADGEMQPGSGLIYEEGASQKLDWLSMIWQDGKNFPSLLYNENVDINNLSITLKIEKNKWYFFCFPFNMDLTNASYPSKHYVWRYYDSDERALHGVGGWKNNVGNTLTAGQGYIFQTNKSGDVVLTIANPEFGNGDTEVDLTAHASGELQDANWNFVGNKNLSYYDLNALIDKFQSPITVWDAANSTYNAIVPGDDDYSFHPYEAFFVQKPSGKSKISFSSEGRETYSQKQSMAAARAVIREATTADNARKIVNLTLSDGNKTDKTRVVFNEECSENYEQECDASKFLSSGVPQIYTMDTKRVKYAINERSKGTGIVNIGYVASEAGSYVISAPRMDCPMILKDNVTGAICKLSESAYEFDTEAGTNESRFTLIPDGETSVKDVKSLGGLSLRAVSGGIAVKGLNGKSVAIYSIGGAMITSTSSDGTISLPAGVYVVSYDGNNVKMSVQ